MLEARLTMFRLQDLDALMRHAVVSSMLVSDEPTSSSTL
jgi:hypothetical protein